MRYKPPKGSSDPATTQWKEDCVGTMKEFAGVFDREGALDPKTTQLVALASMGAAGCTSGDVLAFRENLCKYDRRYGPL